MRFIHILFQHWSPIFSLFKDLATATAAMVGIFVAISGLNAWKKQLRGKTDYELARRYLRAVFKLRDAIQLVRNPLITAGEFSVAVKEIKKEIDDKDAEIDDKRAVYAMRWKKVIESSSDLELESLEAQVSWGQAFTENEKPLLDLIRNLNIKVMFLLDKEIYKDMREEVDKVVYNIDNLDGTPNKYTEELKVAVKKVEDYLRPYLQ